MHVTVDVATSVQLHVVMDVTAHVAIIVMATVKQSVYIRAIMRALLVIKHVRMDAQDARVDAQIRVLVDVQMDVD